VLCVDILDQYEKYSHGFDFGILLVYDRYMDKYVHIKQLIRTTSIPDYVHRESVNILHVTIK
jgi:hypothetical protein